MAGRAARREKKEPRRMDDPDPVQYTREERQKHVPQLAALVQDDRFVITN
jgi:hypothetical protein